MPRKPQRRLRARLLQRTVFPRNPSHPDYAPAGAVQRNLNFWRWNPADYRVAKISQTRDVAVDVPHRASNRVAGSWYRLGMRIRCLCSLAPANCARQPTISFETAFAEISIRLNLKHYSTRDGIFFVPLPDVGCLIRDQQSDSECESPHYRDVFWHGMTSALVIVSKLKTGTPFRIKQRAKRSKRVSTES